MTVHTTYFAALDHDLVEPNEEDYVVGIVRYMADWAEDVVDRNIDALAPPERVLDAYKTVEEAAEADDSIQNPNRVAWNSTNFEQQYRDYLTSANLSSVLGTLRAREQSGDIWLVCYEKDPRYCHRRLLAQEMTRGREASPVHHPEPGEPQDGTEGVPDARLDQFQDGGGLA